EHHQAVPGIVIADLVAGGLDACDQLRVSRGALADQEKGSLGVVTLQYVQDLRREDWNRAVVERERDQFVIRADAIKKLGGKPFQSSKHKERLGPEDEQGQCHHYTEYTQQNRKHVRSIGPWPPLRAAGVRCRRTRRSQPPAQPSQAPCRIA